MARMSLDELRTRTSTVDRAKVDATSEAEIEAHRAADGDADLDVTDGARVVESPRTLRVRLGMTQPEIAAALCIPLGTWRNWEQGRVNLEPAAMALLKIVSHSPEVALAALSGGSVVNSNSGADSSSPRVKTSVKESFEKFYSAVSMEQPETKEYRDFLRNVRIIGDKMREDLLRLQNVSAVVDVTDKVAVPYWVGHSTKLG